MTAYEEGLEIRRRLMAADPTNAGRARDVSVSLNRIGDVRSSRNELQGALRAYEEGLEIRRGLMAADPSHSERARDVFISLANIGLLHRQGGDKKAACRKFREALPIITALAGSAPGIYQLQQDFADIQRVIAETGCSPS